MGIQMSHNHVTVVSTNTTNDDVMAIFHNISGL